MTNVFSFMFIVALGSLNLYFVVDDPHSWPNWIALYLTTMCSFYIAMLPKK